MAVNLIRRLGRSMTVAVLRRCYRGWADLGFFEQVAERAIFRREGWAWAAYLKSGRALDEEGRVIGPDADPVFAERPPLRAEVRIDFTAPDGRAAGAYRATVEFSGRRPGQGECGGQPWECNSYRLTRLVRLGAPGQAEERRTATASP